MARRRRTFLDTNVFLHAAGRPHPLKEACSRVLGKVADGSLDSTGVHAATMLRNGVSRIVSVDPDFDKVPGIRRLAPSAVG